MLIIVKKLKKINLRLLQQKNNKIIQKKIYLFLITVNLIEKISWKIINLFVMYFGLKQPTFFCKKNKNKMLFKFHI